jgi:hypothetical protein
MRTSALKCTHFLFLILSNLVFCLQQSYSNLHHYFPAIFCYLKNYKLENVFRSQSSHALSLKLLNVFYTLLTFKMKQQMKSTTKDVMRNLVVFCDVFRSSSLFRDVQCVILCQRIKCVRSA